MDKTAKQEKKGMSPKAKKIANIIVTALQVAIVIATVVVSIFVWTTTGRGDASGNKKFQMLAIRSNSMKGDNKDSFSAGDLIIVKAPEDAAALTERTVVAYKHTISGGGTTIVTHRIVEIIPPVEEGGNIRYRTQGDNEDVPDTYTIQAGDIVGVYSGKLKGVGAALLWLQGYKRVPIADGYGWDYAGNTNNFLYIIILPLIALLLWNGYSMIRIIMEGKLKKARDEAAAAAVAQNAAVIDAEEIKRRAVEEYLASLNASTPDNPPFRAESPERSENPIEESPDKDPETGTQVAVEGKEQRSERGARRRESADKPEATVATRGSIAADSGNGGFDNSEAQPEQPDNSPEEQDPPDQPDQPE